MVFSLSKEHMVFRSKLNYLTRFPFHSSSRIEIQIGWIGSTEIVLLISKKKLKKKRLLGSKIGGYYLEETCVTFTISKCEKDLRWFIYAIYYIVRLSISQYGHQTQKLYKWNSVKFYKTIKFFVYICFLKSLKIYLIYKPWNIIRIYLWMNKLLNQYLFF